MLKKVLLVLAVAVGVFAVVVSMQPSEFVVSRSKVIAAPAEVIFPHVNNLRNWQAWSPWAQLDPSAKESFMGPAEGQGAAMTWDGNKDVGMGTMTITASQPNDHVGFRLDFLKPFKATSTADFTFEPVESGTQVTWTMTGNNNFIGKAISLFMDCDQMVGGQFEQGLENLAGVVQG